MASVKFGKDSREFKIFNALWGLFQKYGIPEDDDKYWESLFDEMSELIKKEFDNDKLAIEFGAIVLNELERKFYAR